MNIAKEQNLVKKPVPTAQDYVQDGLIAMWDGKENAGWGEHSSSISSWKNLIADAKYPSDIELHGARIDKNSIYFNGVDAYGIAPKLNTTGWTEKSLTMEICASVISADTTFRFGWSFAGAGVRPSVDINTVATHVYPMHGGTATLTADSILAQIHSVSVAFSTGYGFLALNGTPIVPQGMSSIADSRLAFYGANTNNRMRVAVLGTASDANGIFSEMVVRSIRLYNAALSKSQIAANCEIDKARFNLT